MKLKNIILSSLFAIGLISNTSASILNEINNVDLKKIGLNKLPTFKDGFNYTKEQQKIISGILNQLNKNQYLRQDIDLNLGNKVLDVIIKELDSKKIVFTKKDVNDILEEYGVKDNNPVTTKNINLAYQIYYLYLIRKAESIQVKLNYIKSLNKEPNLNTNIKLQNKQKEYLSLSDRNKVLKHSVLNDLIELRIDNISAYNKSKYVKENKDKKKTTIKSFSKLKSELINKYESELNRINNNDVSDAFTVYVKTLAHSGDFRTYWNGPKRDPKIYNGLIGIAFKVENDSLIVASVTGASKESGKIKKGDVVIGIANNDPKNIKYFSNYPSLSRFLYDIAGKENEKVYISIKRDGGEVFVVEITRKKSTSKGNEHITSVEYVGKNGRYVSFVSSDGFYFDYGKDARKLLQNQGYKGVIIDLRNNGGGYIYSANQLASAFVPIGTVVTIGKYGNDKYAKVEYSKTKLPQVFDGALFVLQNSGSASASEMTAGWVEALKRGYLLGGKSYGKGSIQNDASLGYSWYANSLHRTIGKFYDPSGKGGQLNSYKPTVYFAQNKGNPYKDYEINNINPAPSGSTKAYKWFKPFEQYVTDSITKEIIKQSDKLKKESSEYKALQAYVNELKKEWTDYEVINLNNRISHENKLNELYLARVNIQRKLDKQPIYKNYYEIPSDFDLKDIERELSFQLLDYYVGLLEKNKEKSNTGK